MNFTVLELNKNEKAQHIRRYRLQWKYLKYQREGKMDTQVKVLSTSPKDLIPVLGNYLIKGEKI